MGLGIAPVCFTKFLLFCFLVHFLIMEFEISLFSSGSVALDIDRVFLFTVFASNVKPPPNVEPRINTFITVNSSFQNFR